MRAFHENPRKSHLLTLKAHITKKLCMFCRLFEASLTNSVDPGQTAPVGAV